ncbi:MAG: DUF4091 domain-containing protein [Candidatus Hydrogenedentes bacterium]|nr:DUF4091 domain-containing protein [Candidatus Hydrogenedentota bacterium]
MGTAPHLAYAQAPAYAQVPASFRIDTADLPDQIKPGQRVIGNLALSVVEPGDPPYTRPFASFRSLVDPQVSVRLPAGQHTPWKWPGPHAPGDVLRVAFTLDVPLDAPAGPAEFQFQVARHPEGEGWQYASIQSGEGPASSTARWKTEVVAAASPVPDEGRAAVPFVVPGMEPPAIDGRVSVEEWARAGQIDGFVENLHGGAPAAATRAWAGHDVESLYIAVVCEEPALSEVTSRTFSKRDGAVWNNECIEVFVDPQADRASYIHFLVDILNQRHDALGSDYYGYNPDWQSAVTQGDGQWAVEMAIPFLALGTPPPEPGQCWFANLCRERKVVSELSAWRATRGSFAAPGRFGTWVFDSLKAFLEAEAGHVAERPMELPQELASEAEAWQQRFTAWRTRIGVMDDGAAAREFGVLAGELDGLRDEQDKLLLQGARIAGESFCVARAWPYERFSGAASPQDRPCGPVDVTLLQKEWLDLAWNMTNLSDRPVVVRCTTRYNQDGHGAERLRLGIPGLQTIWHEALPVAAADGSVVYDALAPRPAGILHIAPGQTGQIWLSVRAQEAGAAALSGQIVIEPIDGSPGEPVSIPLAVHVLEAALLAGRSLHTFTWNLLMPEFCETRPEWCRAHYEDLAAHGVDVAMIHRLRMLGGVKANVDGVLVEQPDFAMLDRFLEQTMDLFDQYFLTCDIWEKGRVRRDFIGLDFESPEYEKAFKQWLRLVLDKLFSHGLTYERFMLNPYDESLDARCRAIARWVKEVDPNVRIVIDCSTPDLDEARKMDAFTDVWMPHFKTFFPDDMKAFHELVIATGKPRWCYYYSEGSNDKLQDPTRHYLAKFWWAFDVDLAGVAYWAQQYYGDPWYRAAYRNAYDTSLVYPAESGPMPSRRWQAWRRGWQDHCLLSLARERCRQDTSSGSLARFDEVVDGVVAVPGDPNLREEARGWLKAIVADGP